MMVLGMLVLAATLSSPGFDPASVAVPTESCADVHDHSSMPVPKLLDESKHLQMHEELNSSKHGAQEQTIWCDTPDSTAIYKEFVYFSDASHSTVIGWRIVWCTGGLHWSGQVSAFCDRYLECCNPPYDNQIDTCE